MEFEVDINACKDCFKLEGAYRSPDCCQKFIQVAHLKESEPIQSTQITKPMTTCNGKINSGGICELCCQPAHSSSGYCGRMIKESEPKKPEFKNGDIITLNTGFSCDQGTFLRWEGDKVVWKDNEGTVYKSPLSNYKITLVESEPKKEQTLNDLLSEATFPEPEEDYSHPLTMGQIIEEETRNEEISEEVNKEYFTDQGMSLTINQTDEAKEEYYRYGQSLGISINDLQRLKTLAVSKDSQSEIESLNKALKCVRAELRVMENKLRDKKEQTYINKILDLTNTATFTQAHAAVAAIKALCKECLGDLAPNKD